MGADSIIIEGSSEIQSIFLERQDGEMRVAVKDDSLVESATVNEGSKDVVLEGDIKTSSLRLRI